MILHLLCFLMMMVVSVVICAPGQNTARQSIELADDDSKATEQVFRVVDPLGGGNLVLSDKKEQKKESLVSRQDNVLSTLTLSAREEKAKKRHMSSHTLDPLGGGHLLKAIDPDSETQNFITSELLANYKEDTTQNMMLQARVDKPTRRPSSSGMLDPIGGGNLVRVADLDREAQNFRAVESFVKPQDDILLERGEKSTPRPSSSGTLDPIGGGNLIGAVDPTAEAQNFREMELAFSYQDDIPVERKDKPKTRPSSYGTLDSLGGGNILRAVDPRTEAHIFREMEFLVNKKGRQNMMRLAREDKSSQRSAHAPLDSLANGRLVGVVDPYRGNQIFRSVDRNHLLDSLDNYQGGEVIRVLDALTGSDLLSSLDSAEGVAVLGALKKTHTKHPKRMLDSVSGWAFGESKRNFDEIDNVGFTGFAKKSPYYNRKQYEALAKKNFDEIDRAGFETYNKRDFDEIDRTGFETFEKRDRKE